MSFQPAVGLMHLEGITTRLALPYGVGVGGVYKGRGVAKQDLGKLGHLA